MNRVNMQLRLLYIHPERTLLGHGRHRQIMDMIFIDQEVFFWVRIGQEVLLINFKLLI